MPSWRVAVWLLVAGAAARWQPQPSSNFVWNYVLQAPVEGPPFRNVSMVDVDLFDTAADTVRALQAQGIRVVAYINCGAWEDWRPDAANFSVDLRGKPLDGWPGESWFNVASAALRPPLAWRFDLAVTKGFDAIECDNVDGYLQDTGFGILEADQLAFNRWFAGEAHARNLSVGLKNALSLASALVDSFDFALNEQCHHFDECKLLVDSFVAAGKAVFGVEYEEPPASFCASSSADELSFIWKELALKECPVYSCAAGRYLCGGATSVGAALGARLLVVLLAVCVAALL
eukprot:Amastigsp_a512914_13.p1 type:complete len:289 gc:universal Amastigsp_a512914_13:1054-188(-)